MTDQDIETLKRLERAAREDVTRTYHQTKAPMSRRRKNQIGGFVFWSAILGILGLMVWAFRQ